MAARSKRERLSRGRAERGSVLLRRDPVTKSFQPVGPDTGTDERKRQQGGVEVGYRTVGSGGVAELKGVWAKATGVFEAMELVGILGDRATQQDLLRRRLDAGAELRSLAHRAGLCRSTTGLYEVRQSKGRVEMSDAAALARQKLWARGSAILWWRMYLLLDILVLEQIPAKEKWPKVLDALDLYADQLRMAKAREDAEAACLD